MVEMMMMAISASQVQVAVTVIALWQMEMQDSSAQKYAFIGDQHYSDNDVTIITGRTSSAFADDQSSAQTLREAKECQIGGIISGKIRCFTL